MVFAKLFDPVLSPLLVLGDFWALIILTFLVSLLITIIYKYVTDQQMMKQLKEDLKRMQKEAKEQRKNPERMMKLQKQMMEKNMILMKHSMKPTLITFIPLILIIGWLQAHMAFEPIQPGEQFSVAIQTVKGFTGTVTFLDTPNVQLASDNNQTPVDRLATFRFTAEQGLHSLQFQANGAPFSVDVLVSDGGEYGQQTQPIKKGGIQQAIVGYQKKLLLDLGFVRFGWLGTYIILSLLFSIGLRKVLRVY